MTEKNKIPGVGDLFSRTFNLYQKRFWTLITIGILAALAFFVFQGMFAALGDVRRFTQVPGAFAAHLVINFIVLVLGVTISIWQSTALVVAIRDSEEAVGPVEAYRKAWKFCLKFFWVSVLTAFAVLGGFILLVIPGIYLAVALSLAPLVLIAEDGKGSGLSMLQRSRLYLKGFWWKAFGRYLLLLLILLGFGVVLGIIFFLPLTFFAALSQKLSLVLRGVGNSVIDIILAPFSITYWYLIYTDLKKAKESQELA